MVAVINKQYQLYYIPTTPNQTNLNPHPPKVTLTFKFFVRFTPFSYQQLLSVYYLFLYIYTITLSNLSPLTPAPSLSSTFVHCFYKEEHSRC